MPQYIILTREAHLVEALAKAFDGEHFKVFLSDTITKPIEFIRVPQPYTSITATGTLDYDCDTYGGCTVDGCRNNVNK